MRKLNLDLSKLKSLNPVLYLLLVYLILFLVLIFNISSLQAYTLREDLKFIKEGILLPKTNKVDQLFNVDPLLSDSNNQATIQIRKKISSLVFSSLFREEIDGSMTKDIVEDYTFTDASNLEIKIKENILWSDGTLLTTNDIDFTINTIRSLGSLTHYSGVTNSGSLEIEKIDNFRIRILLRNSDGPRPNSAYLHELTFPILPAHVFVNYTKPDFNGLPQTDFGRNPVTSGHFKYESNKIDQLTLITNRSYYGEIPQVDGYILRFYRNYDEILDAFKLKNINFFIRDENLRDNIHNQIKSSNLQSTEHIIRNRRYALYFNLNSKSEDLPVFNEFVVPRRALGKAINREEFSNRTNIKLRTIYGPIDHESWAFSDSVLGFVSYDKAEFDKAIQPLGYKKNEDGIYEKDGKKLELKITFLDNEFNKLIFDYIASDFRDAGVIANPRPVPAESFSDILSSRRTFNAVVNDRDYDILLTYVDRNFDPDSFAEWHSSRSNPPGLNFSGLSSRVIDRVLADARVIPDRDGRKVEYERFQRAFYNESAPAIFLFNPSVIVYKQDDVNITIPENLTNLSAIYQDISKWSIK
jgi:peptide/nickel transport system substrate-binding protein